MDTDARIFVAGHKGMIGSAVMRKLSKEGYKNVLTQDRSMLDLTDTLAVHEYFRKNAPEYVVLAAGKTGGIAENQRVPVQFLHDNLSITLNVLAAAHQNKVKRLIYLCASCMYPSHCPQPMKEDQILCGKPDNNVLPTAVGKMAGLQLCHAYNKQFGAVRFIPAIPNSVYGPNDDFDPASGHVLSALIHRVHEAKRQGIPAVELWGSGAPRREFVYADDAANALFALLKAPLSAEELPVNIGVGEDYSIKELAGIVSGIVGYSGKITWNTEKPDGAPRKLLDNERIRRLGWSPSVGLQDGIRDTYQWYLANVATEKGRAQA